MVTNMEPCCCLRNSPTHTTSSVIRCCGKRPKVSNEKDPGFQLEFFNLMTDQLLLEVLIRLPSNTACRFKAVCKNWCSLISSSYFQRRFIDHRLQHYGKGTPRTFTLVFQHEIQVPSPRGTSKCLEPIEAISNCCMPPYSFKNHPLNLNFLPRFDAGKFIIPAPISVRASCHDLLLCSHFGTYYVVNLFNHQWVVLPPVSSFGRKPSGPRTIVGTQPGLLYYHNQNDIDNGAGLYKFKVILIPVVNPYFAPRNVEGINIHVPPDIYSSQFTIKLFCSESAQWTDVIVDWYPLQLTSYICCTPMLAHDKMLHWMNGRSLVSLDPFRADSPLSLCNTINLPDEYVPGEELEFGVSRGHLRVAYRVQEVGDGPVIHVWDLRDYHRGSWSLAHKVVIYKSTLGRLSQYFELIAFHPYNADVFFLKKDRFIYRFNMRSGKLKEYRKLKLGKGCRCRMLVNIVSPLLHQWFPSPVPSLPLLVDA